MKSKPIMKPIFLFVLLFIGVHSFGVSQEEEHSIGFYEIMKSKIEHLKHYKSLYPAKEIYCIPSMVKLYSERNYKLIWTRQQDISDLKNAIEQSFEHGLNPSDYHIDLFEEFSGQKSIEDLVIRDVILTDAFLLFSSHVLSGKTNPVSIGAQWHILKTEQNPTTFIEKIGKESLYLLILSLYPKHESYQRLIQELAFYRQIEAEGGFPKIDEGTMLKPGMSDYRVYQIKHRLMVSGEYSKSNTADSLMYDESLSLAVVKFQNKHGIEALGNVGPETFAALNVPVEEWIKKLEVNMERWRWLPVEFNPYYLLVNIANFELQVMDNDRLLNHQKVIVGRPYRKTPVFSSHMEYLDLNPTWTVPPTILRNDLVPEIRKDVGYLGRKKISVFSQDGQKLNPDSINWNSNGVYSFTYRQASGDLNALGRIKFVFPNPYNVYLHDTPARELFNRTERAFSSGCIRVEKPVELAELLLADQEKWSQASIRKAIETNISQTIRLTRKPAVYVLYWTAWMDNEGSFHFSKDIYDRDSSVYKALKSNPVYQGE